MREDGARLGWRKTPRIRQEEEGEENGINNESKAGRTSMETALDLGATTRPSLPHITRTISRRMTGTKRTRKKETLDYSHGVALLTLSRMVGLSPHTKNTLQPPHHLLWGLLPRIMIRRSKVCTSNLHSPLAAVFRLSV